MTPPYVTTLITYAKNVKAIPIKINLSRNLASSKEDGKKDIRNSLYCIIYDDKTSQTLNKYGIYIKIV